MCSPNWCRFESGLSRLHTHPSGAGLSPRSRRLRGSQPCGCTSPEAGNDLLSLFLSPAEAGHMVGVAQRESGGLQNRASPVRIRPRPPGRIRVRCQKWESPNLSNADSRQRPPAGVEPCPAVIWGSSSVVRAIGLIHPNGSPVRARPVPQNPKADRVRGRKAGNPLPAGGSRFCPVSRGLIAAEKSSALR